jgi:hypothetical protein
MIKSDVFYRGFESGLESVGRPAAMVRSGGKIPKYTVATPVGKLKFWFKVNGKASAIPHQPGEFWPVIESNGMAHNERDDGAISWYQYTSPEMEQAFHNQQRLVRSKTEAQASFELDLWRQTRDLWLSISRESIDLPFGPGFPHTTLYYLDEADATQWGVVIGQQFSLWLARFSKHPETLEAYMWRVHWSQRPQA